MNTMKILKMTSALLIWGTFSFADEIYISAAASLTDVISEIKEKYETNNPNINITPIYAGTGTLLNKFNMVHLPIYFCQRISCGQTLNERDTLKVKDIHPTH